ncbi:MAG: hypothetical protein EMLJLAPB_00722 [Candidatus Argoarchaeum ethanivorans]|uniref:Uncharacterized protein n=1 Tax=Candidatus Argoarchaeum ethanivorans TaxID=2608793 RepID=A0A811TGL8_9EURY|nr:MAG: hypothetical protein KFBDDELM_00209 [Candidatus Argoarchaeum ethanivorans]CAD6493657.1 MAG: hypothetical protein FFODKBPE_00539 [Candidatus Argoarchaeum ethanivorans]CAD6494161.1 MAG: hypothetical protein EMLJLAPB_00722 [Candidatus Argoarchaeum ethanivorans]
MHMQKQYRHDFESSVQPHTTCAEITLDYASTVQLRCAEIPATLDYEVVECVSNQEEEI